MRFYTPQFIASPNMIMACHITGVFDVNRNTTLIDNDYELVREWSESIKKINLKGVIFHNNFSEETCKKYENESLNFIKVDYNPAYNPNVYRYFVYRDFLENNAKQIESFFITDVSDVVVVKNPFIEPYFIENRSAIFCGDEPKSLNNEWMIEHSNHLREKIMDYVNYENEFGKETLLNCGIIGGKTNLMQEFIQRLCIIHQQYNFDNKTAFTGDMGAFNYLARTEYNNKLKHGAPVNTVFKMYQSDRADCWFRHK